MAQHKQLFGPDLHLQQPHLLNVPRQTHKFMRMKAEHCPHVSAKLTSICPAPTAPYHKFNARPFMSGEIVEWMHLSSISSLSPLPSSKACEAYVAFQTALLVLRLTVQAFSGSISAGDNNPVRHGLVAG